MADSITKTMVIKNSNNQVVKYLVTFSLSVGSKVVPYTTTVLASKLSNPADMTAVKTAACAAACAFKTKLTALSQNSSTVDGSINGPVTL